MLVANPDVSAPYPDRRLSVEPGYWALRIEAETGVPCEPYGKPFAPAFELALSRLGSVGSKRERVTMVGDGLYTDILGGLAAGNPEGLSATERKLGPQMVASARTAIAEAKEARRKGIEVQTRIAAAGGRLTSTVDRIIGEVDAAIQASASDLSTLSGIIGGLGGIYGEFPGAPAVSVFGTSVSQTGLQRRHAFSELAKKTAAVASDTLIISDFVTSLSLAQPVEALKACRVDPKTITTAMSIQPASASFSGTRDETRPFLVQGGAFPYMMSVRGTDSNLVSVDQPAGFGPSFTITVKSGAPAGLYAIHVADGSRRTASLPLEVVGAALVTTRRPLSIRRHA